MDSNRVEITGTLPEPKPASRRRVRLGYVLAALCLVWVFYDIEPARLWNQIGAIHWGLVVLAVGVDILAFVCQGLRWQLLLRPLGQTSVWKTTEAVYAGLFVNEVSPLRAGEALRIFLMARRLKVPVLAVVSTVTIERLFDGIWVAFGISMISLSIPLPRPLLRAANIFDIVLFGAILLFLALALHRPAAAAPAPGGPRSKFWQWIGSSWQHFRTGLHQVSFSSHFFFSWSVSLFVMFFQALSFWLLARAYGLHLSFWAGVAVFIIVLLGTAIPNTPGNVGAYQFFTVVGLSIFGVEKTLATGFSVVAFVLLTAPLLLLGFVAVTRSGLTLATLRTKLAS
jgi:glycosyltransferase 2 family protein